MNQPNQPRKKNPTFGVSILIVVVVSLVIATVLYNAITEKREFDRENSGDATAASTSAPAPSPSAATAGAASNAAH
ncbi:hypothetical protein GCM10027093_16030 [Paraburkholderia jirisanensis]